MLRIWFASPELADFESAAPDDHVKLFVPDDAGELVARDYTPRLFDPEQRNLAIDFVLHEAGPATAWARAAKEGDTLLIGGPRGSNIVADDFGWYLLLGDETAIPAIARRLEELREGVPVFAAIMVNLSSDAVALQARAGCSVTWLVRGATGPDCDAEQLKEFVDKLPLPPGDGYVWIAAEADTARAIRAHIEEVHDHPREWIKASGYWHRGAPGGHQRLGVQRAMLISGVARGLGAAFADAAIAAGYKTTGTVRTGEDAELAARRGIIPIRFDLNEPESAPKVVAAASAVIGPIEILVNNAGFGHEGIVEESPLDALRRQLNVNVVGQVALIQAVLPGMRAMRRGHIVNVTSMAGSVGLPGVAFYCGAKFAMEGISEALGKELRPLGIHVTAFAPGQFRTDWAGNSLERSPRTIADYDPLMDPLRHARAVKSGQQPGDPRKAAAVLMQLLDLPAPPARVFVGSDALALASQKIKRMQSEITAGDALGRDTDFD